MKHLNDELYALVREDAAVFEFAQDQPLSNLFFWDVDCPENEWTHATLWRILGYKPEEMTGRNEEWQKIINQKDLQKAITAFNDYCQNPAGIYEQTVRYTHKFGNTVWIRGKAIATISKQDSSVRILGVRSNISELKQAEIEVEKQIQRYKNIIEGTDIGTWELNVQTGECNLNERWANMIGYTIVELSPISSKTWEKFVHPDDVGQSNQILQLHLEGKSLQYECEVRLKHKQGHWVWVLDRGKIMSRTPDGKPEWVMGSHQDITERKLVFERNRSFIDQAPSAIAMFDNNICYLAASGKWLTDYHLEGREILGKSHYEIFPEIGEQWKKIHRECLQGATNTCDEVSFERADGTTQWISWDVRPWYISNGKIGGIIMNTADITHIKEKEQEKQRIQEILDKTNEVARIGTWEVDLKTGSTKWSRIAKEIHEVPSTFEVHFYDTFSFYKEGKSREKIRKAVSTSLENGTPYDLEVELNTANNNTVWIRAIGQTEFKNGICIRLYGVIQDISQQKKAEEKLRISEDAFRKNFENAAIGMAVLSKQGQWLRVNDAVCKITGYTSNELKTKTFQDITHPDDLAIDLTFLHDLVDGKIPFYQMEKRYFHKDGHVIYIILSVSLVRSETGDPLYFISQIVDISQSVIAKKKLEEALANLEGVLEGSSHVSIIGVDTNGLITQFNKGAENLLGYSRDEMLFKQTPHIIHVREEMDRTGKELSIQFNEKIEGLDVFVALTKNSRFDKREWTYIRKDGTMFPVLLVVTATKTGYLGIAADISEIKKAENEVKSLLEITNGQNERLRNFAHIVSHNLRSHSGNFRMLLDLLKEGKPAMAEDELVKMLVMASKNLEETIANLNEVALMNTSVADNLVPINLFEATETAIKNVGIIAKDASVRLVNNISLSTVVMALPAYIDSILLNFFTNGIRYKSNNRDSFVKLSANIEDGVVVISAEDNGIGIDLKKYGSKIFGMYKTFHGNKDARGIGLFITKNQVEAMGGKIEVESEVNKGTIFKILLRYEKD